MFTSKFLTFRYESVTKEEDFKSWYDAKRYCQAHGGRLMEVRTLEQFEKAKTFQIPGLNKGPWLGGNDFDTEGVWVWNSDREQIDMGRYWRRGQPGSDYGNEDCLFMHGDGLQDGLCRLPAPFVCEFFF